MISADERSPAGGDIVSVNVNDNDNGSSRLSPGPQHNNNNGENNLYNDYIPSSGVIRSASSSPPLSPILPRSNQIVLRDPLSGSGGGLVDQRGRSSSLQLPRSSSTHGITDFIQHTLSSRLIPKLGSIVKRFSLNYSGEGLVTDRQRTRTVRVGIRFQVQVDSFVDGRLEQDQRPRAILRTQSAPAVEQLDSGFSSPTEIFQNNRQLAAIEYQTDNNKSSNSTYTSTSSVQDCCGGSSSSPGSSYRERGGILIGGDSSSGVSSESGSPVLNRRERERECESENSTTTAFHNRINQALHSYRRSQLGSSPPTHCETFPRARRSSVTVFRTGSSTPPERVVTVEDLTHSHSHSQGANMEDSSSYQVLRHFPGSNVNSLNELNWETAAFEKEIRERLQWIGDKVSCIRLPRVISQLMDFGKEYARENPVSAFILLALCLTSSAPVLMFLVFAVATILVTFLGFLFVEGTLLTVATVIFGGVILVVGFLTLTAVLIGMMGYFTTNQAYLVLTGRSGLFRLLRKLPVIGRLFPEPKEGERRRYSAEGGSEEEEQISKLLNGFAANGKGANGYGHGPVGRHHGEEEDFDDDLLDSEVEEEETAEGVSTDSELAMEEEDLGNQEVVPDAVKAKAVNGAVAAAPVASSPEVEEEESESSSAYSSPVADATLVNGHHHEEDEDDESEEADESENNSQNSEL